MKGCNILWCGQYRQNWSNKLHKHNYFQLLIFLDGKGKVMIEKDVYFGEKGSVFLIQPERDHSVDSIVNKGKNLKLLDIKFDITNRDLYEDLITFKPGYILTEIDWVLEAFHDMVLENNKRKYSYEMANQQLFIILVKLIRKICDQDEEQRLEKSTGTPLSVYNNVNLDKLSDYIEKNYPNIITLNDLASQAHINKTTLTKIYHNVYGMTPMKYLNLVRLNKAKELLINTDVGIGEIAELVGFQSIHYFSRFFKEKENCSPTEYRIRRRQNAFYTFHEMI